ncbi:MAG: histidine phosphatase family protein [Actinomycetes bacterium]
MTHVLLVRHGQSEWNADGRWQGQENPPLTDVGLEQAERAAKAVGALDGIYASPLDRAATTAAVVGDAIGIGPVVTLHQLMERHAGEWQGLTRDDIEAEWPGYLDSGRRPPGWEPDEQVEQRAFAALEQIATDHPYGHVLAVSHAGIIFAIERALGVEWERLANLSGRWLERPPAGGRWSIGPRVHLLVDETIPDQI